jgi:type I restriction-modification system DNA methylase subunit
MRLAAQMKMGYYPTPPIVTELIASMLVDALRGPIRIIDSCAGEGTAIKLLGERLNAETFGIENQSPSHNCVMGTA